MQWIDTHLHLWDTAQFRYPWRQGGVLSGLPPKYLLDDALAETGGKDITFVVVQAEVDHASDPVGETAWLQRIADEHPNGGKIAGFVAYADLSRPDIASVLERHAQHGVFCGIRQEIWWEVPSTRADVLEENLLENPNWRQNFVALAKVNAGFDLTCWHSQLGPFAAFLSEYPSISVVIDHLGSPIVDDDTAMDVWREGIAALAALPNTYMKISGLSQADPHWTVDGLKPVIDHVLKAFGSERCMLGSNFPVEKPTSTYGTVWAAYETLLSGLTIEEQENLYSATAKRAYRLNG